MLIGAADAKLFQNRRVRLVNSTLKQRVLGTLDDLGPDATLEDVIERLVFLAKIDRGLADAAAGRLTPHDEVVAQLRAKFSK